MKFRKIVSFWFSALVILSMSMTLVSSVSAAPPPNVKAQGGGVELNYDPDTGQLISVRAPSGGVSASAAGNLGALGFVNMYASAFGLSDPANELTEQSVKTYGNETVTRYQQVYQGVPVFGGALAVTTDANGALAAMAGKISKGLSVDVAPTVTPDQAISAAQAVTLKTYMETYKLKAENLSFSTPVLQVYDEKMFTDPTLGAQLVWKVDATATNGAPVHEVVLVNAQVGIVAAHYNKIDAQWNIPPATAVAKKQLPSSNVTAMVGGTPLWSIWSAGNVSLTDAQLTTLVAGAAGCADGIGALCTDWQASDAKTYALDVYNFYWIHHARDSIDGAGMRLKSVVSYCSVYACPYYNAFWDGAKMVYGDFMAVDDVAAHELTHGVTENTSGLIYMFQSGAINESLSDVWGELVDLSNLHDYYGNDTTLRWLVGEDIRGPAYAFRSMKNPPLKGDPDRMGSAYYYKGVLDNGGVHTNSGVNNKAAYLMTDGGTFNGRVITGLGINKVAAIYYRAQTVYLVPSSDYLSLYYALNGSCTDLIGGAEGITITDCAQVTKATQAVQMNIRPAAINGTVVTSCPAGYSYGTPLLTDNLEGGTGNWTFNAVDNFSSPIATSWQTTTSTTNSMNTTTALYAPGPSMIINGVFGDGAQESATLTTPVVLPAGQKIFLTFEHQYLLEPYNYDGAILEYSVNGGSTWVDARYLFNAGTNYNGVIRSYTGDTNPLRGRAAWVANSRNDSQGMRYNLTALAGQSVQLRWRIGYDWGSYWGYWLDNVDIHTCAPTPAIPLQVAPVNGALIPQLPTNYQPKLDWANVTTNMDHYAVQVSTDSAFTLPLLYDVNPVTPLSEYTIPVPLTENTKYYWRVSARNSFNGSRGWSPIHYFRTAMLPATLLAPADTITETTDRPLFDWGDVTGATSYIIQASRYSNFSILLVNNVVVPSQFTPVVDLPGATLLYWRVIARGANPSWSATFSFTTANPPTVPVLRLPANLATGISVTPTLNWYPSVAPVGSTLGNYAIQIDDTADFSSTVISDPAVITNSYIVSAITPLNPSTWYYWHVRSTNTLGDYSGWSIVRRFKTAP